MMKHFVAVLSVFALLQLVCCKPFTKDSRIELPGSERIYKRSIETPRQLFAPFEEGRLEQVDFGTVGVVRPLPVFGKRSVNKRDVNNVEESDDEMKIAENGLVFLPMFRARNGVVRNQRSRRSIQDADKTILLNRAQIDDLEGAETIIFRPVFRSQLRPARSIVQEDLDDMEVAENGLIFRPVFRTRQHDTV